MSKKSKKTGWLWKGKQADPEPEITHHKTYDENGNEVIDWEAEVFGDDWNRKPAKQDKIDWGNYEKTGHWGGYERYRTSTLSYSYVQQVANMIASQHNITVKIGNGWGVDIDGKTLTYNPTSLMFMSKGELLATLLHEVGKIALCHSMKRIKNPYIDKYSHVAYEVLSVFDDFRVDDRMINSYPSAGEVYESLDGVLQKVVETYQFRGEAQENKVKSIVTNDLEAVEVYMKKGMTFEEAYRKRTGAYPILKSYKEYTDWVSLFLVAEFPSVWNYMAAVIDKGYGVNTSKHTAYMEGLFNKTSAGVSGSVKQDSTQGVSEMMNTEVYPHIEDLLKANEGGSESMKNALGEQVAGGVMDEANQEVISEMVWGGKMENNTQPMNARHAKGRGDNSIPKEWSEGDYNPLRESVDQEIKSLYQKMVNLRRTEQIVKYQNNQRRGKLNTKALFKHSTGSRRLFKKKTEQTDRIRSFAFSIMVDASGSMKGGRIIHATRALIMLSEVFKKLGVEFEIIHFETAATLTKKFDQEYSGKIKSGIASYVAYEDGGGTTLSSALIRTNLLTRPESNKVAIILTDGDTEDHYKLNHRFFTPWEKKGVHSVVLGIETSDIIKGLNNGKGEKIENAAEIPQKFYDLLKTLIFKK